MPFIAAIVLIFTMASALISIPEMPPGIAGEAMTRVHVFADEEPLIFLSLWCSLCALTVISFFPPKKTVHAKKEVIVAPQMVIRLDDQASVSAALLAMENSLSGCAQLINEIKQVDLDEGLKGRIAEVNKRVASLRERLNAYVDDPDSGKSIAALASLKKQVEALEGAISDLDNSGVARKVSDIESLLRDFIQQAANLDPVMNKLPKLKEQLDRLESRLAPMLDVETGSKALFHRVDNGVGELESNLDELERGINEDTFEEDVEALQDNVDDIGKRAEEASALFDRLRTAGKNLVEATSGPV